jgi:two-component system, OmpR family, sensor histidine kinase KdpD
MNDDNKRPDPDILLSRIKGKETKTLQGKLKIFFGMCAGVGKTYSMLEAAKKAQRDGIDVAVGVVETHNRLETAALLESLEVIPPQDIMYREFMFKEMNLDLILTRNPSLVLVDELAHTNIPGSRHAKRYQDVLELLSKGIDVYTTLNLQHLESRSVTVKEITGTTIRETVPDTIFDRADEIELVDITVDELLQRLKEGKVYTPEKSVQAIENFFRRGNLSALREMSLRLTAERIDKDVKEYRLEKNISTIWKAGQKFMVAVGASPYSAQLIRWTRRLAYSMEAPWIAVNIDRQQKLSNEEKKLLLKNLQLAKDLGAEIVTVQDTELISGLLNTAQDNNVTQIIIGKSRELSFWRRIFHHDFVRKLISKSKDIDIYVVGGEEGPAKKINPLEIIDLNSPLPNYIISFAVVTLLTILFYSIQGNIGYQTVSLLFLLTIILLPLFNIGRGPILFAALLSAFCWDYYFIPPKFTFSIEKVNDVLMLIMYFVVAMISGLFTSKIKKQQVFLKQKEERTSSLYNLTKNLSSANSMDDIADISVKQLSKTFDAEVAMIFQESVGKLAARPDLSSTLTVDDSEWHIAQWVFLNNQTAGRFTNTLSLSSATFYPMQSRSGVMGVIGIKTNDEKAFSFDQENLLMTFIAQITNAVEREQLNAAAKNSFLAEESEKLYKTLFNSISHELKTPITTIISATSSLNDKNIYENKSVLNKLIEEINIAADRLQRLVENLLNMARLETGNLKPKLDWHSINDLINSVSSRIKGEAGSHKLIFKVDDEIQLFRFDFGLVEQALVNVIHNCIEYTTIGSEITTEIKQTENNCMITISDNGKGFPEETFDKVFDKFYRIPGTKVGGTGLGLSISKGFIEAHSGTIRANNLKSGGAVFNIIIPMTL